MQKFLLVHPLVKKILAFALLLNVALSVLAASAPVERDHTLTVKEELLLQQKLVDRGVFNQENKFSFKVSPFRDAVLWTEDAPLYCSYLFFVFNYSFYQESWKIKQHALLYPFHTFP